MGSPFLFACGRRGARAASARSVAKAAGWCYQAPPNPSARLMSEFPPAEEPGPPRREPIFFIPPVIVVLIVALVGLYAPRFRFAGDADWRWRAFAFVPKRLTLALWLLTPTRHFH